MKKTLALVLALLMLVPTLASCSEQTSGEETTATDTPTAGEEEAAVEETEEPDPFADVDFGGRDFRVLTSIYVNDSTNADKFIRGTGETNGEIVNDAVYARNLMVSELLGINLKFTESDYGFGDVSTNLKNLALAGADEYDIVSNDIYQLAILAADGYLRNVYNSTAIDLTKESGTLTQCVTCSSSKAVCTSSSGTTSPTHWHPRTFSLQTNPF